MELNYYWSDDFSPSFYINQARAGFIATSMQNMEDELIILPEMQFEYAVLDFENLHISKKVQKLLNQNQYALTINTKFEEVLENIQASHDQSWMEGEYAHTLVELQQNHYENFQLISVELNDSNNTLIAGEIGYIIGKTYTSLSGFTTKEKAYNHWGKLQLVLLSKYLEKNGFDFWNLGHASLQYKLDLGAKVLKREEFVSRWKESINK